ncbi:TraB/GumN family protein [Plebeiibacterium sediminum]|uniref:TraB/GumN family protein n=1 Tax=Plebeiibacterium sediminum TaxID=2992112 RepID=A0AAE3M6S5_9BACT|nr:TraB/GumN family protein [Plebeiobacterium sediminum]MCW3788336.1 TraB/GumN family protein [Plebeiobacterium sediminum]
MRTNLLIIIVFLAFIGCRVKHNQQESLPNHGLLWKITGNDLQSPSYLLGTFHGQGGMLILDSIQSFDSIFTSSNQFICEIDFMNAPKLLLEKKDSKSSSYLKPWPVTDSTYENILTDKQKSILDSVIKKDKSLQIIKDWNIRPSKAINFIKRSHRKDNKNNKLSSKDNLVNDSIKSMILDVYLQQLAKRFNMNVVELDSKEELQNINDSISRYIPLISYCSEADFLIYYIQNYSKIDSFKNEHMDKILSIYLQQDLNLFEQLQMEENLQINTLLSYIVSDDVKEIQKTLLIDGRNNLWMNKIPNLIKSNSSFIAVGAGHLGGEKGLINQLRRLNYSVVSMEKTNTN